MNGVTEPNGGFHYRAGAAALGGQMARPFTEPLEVQAAAFLPPSGGYGSARRVDYRFHEIVSFRAGYTQVIGTTHQRQDQNKMITVHETLASAVVEGLNILDMITADRIMARLASEYPPPPDGGGQFRMLPLGSYFVNLRIAGLLLGGAGGHLTPNKDLLKYDTMKTIEEHCGARHEAAGHRTGSSGSPKRLRLPLFDFGVNNELQAVGAKDKSSGLRIEIPSFGTIILGEYIVAEDHRQLTMVRVELHSPEAGTIDVASVEGNGTPPY